MVRTGLVILVIFGLILLLLPFLILIAWFQGKPDVLYAGARLASRIGLKLAGVRLQVKGLDHVDPRKTYLFVANHQSYFDPLALFSTIPQNPRFIVKRELYKVPILNIGMKLGRFVFIDRRDRGDSLRGMNQAVAQMKRGESFLVFPEGTRTRSGKMGAFKKGPFVIALQSGAPILPITISGSYDVMPPAKLRIKPGTVSVTFHHPLETKELEPNERDPLKERVQNIVASGLVEATEEVRT
ncbi:MAG TPA: lysophospholipid acyltransferase family protein [Terriglobia bacterium]|nr:lysophospholipid acyltransferase family protein [Terriglobia bacterium]